ncbi:MAG: TldD/PmbA family protein [Alphaproteobacteria bacterium]|nr:MAG: TldD/PmbA family protein [Alphaproteobacteria bacterium]
MTDLTDVLTFALDRAKAAGADAAEAMVSDGTSVSVAWRLGRPEKVERAEGRDLGLRLFVGKRQALVSGTDVSRAGIEMLVERAAAMARIVPEDPYCGLATPDQLSQERPDLDQVDAEEPAAERLIALAEAAEDAARAVAGVTNSEGAEASYSRGSTWIATTAGFQGHQAYSRHGLSVSVLAGTGTAMERDYEWTTAVHASDLDAPERLGRRAGERAVARLNPHKLSTGTRSVVFDPRVARGLISHLTSAISGPSIARGTSFLKEALGTQVFATGITIVEDPFRRRGLRSRPVDSEGLAPVRRTLIDQGVLTTWLLDLRSGRQLGLPSTGHASHGPGGLPSPSASNVWIEPGSVTPEELMADIGDGLYVTDLLGMGINGVTGDYSRGAAGFRIVNGHLAEPVSEITIAGNLRTMFLALSVANDLEFRAGIDAPTVRIDGMTIAGS